MGDKTVLIKIRAEEENLASTQKNINALKLSMVQLGRTGMEMSRTMKIADGTFLTTKGVIDPTTKSFVHLGSEISQVGKSTKGGINIAEQYHKALMRVAIVVPIWGAFKLAINTVVGAIKEGTQAYEDFERIMAKVATVTIAMGASMEEFAGLQREANKYISETSAKINDVGNVMYQLGSAGLSTTEIMAGFKKVMDLSIGTMSNAEQTAKVVAGAYRLFGDSLGDALTEQEKFASITNTIAKVFAKEQVEVDEISTALTYVSAAANQVNFKFTDLIGTIGFLNTGMLKGSKSGVYLAQGIIKAAQNVDELEKATGKAFDRSKPLEFINVMEVLYKKFGSGKLAIQEQNELLAIFDIRGVKAIQSILSNWNEWQLSIQNSNNNITNFDTKLRETLENSVPAQLDKLKNKWKSAWISMGEEIEPAILPALKKINKELEDGGWENWIRGIMAYMTLGTSEFPKIVGILSKQKVKPSTQKSTNDKEKLDAMTRLALEEEARGLAEEKATIVNASEKDLKKYEERLKAIGATELQIETAKLVFMEKQMGWIEEIEAKKDQRAKIELEQLKALGQESQKIREMVSSSLADSLKTGDLSGFFDSFKTKLRDSILETVAESFTNQVMNVTGLDIMLGKATESMKIERSFIDGSTVASQNLYNAIVRAGSVVSGQMGGSSSIGAGANTGDGGIFGKGVALPVGYQGKTANINGMGTVPVKPSFMDGLMGNVSKMAGAGLLAYSLFGGNKSQSSMSRTHTTSPSGGTVAATTASTTKAYVTNINMPVTFNLPDSVGTDTKSLVKAMASSMTPVLQEMVKKVLEAENINSGNI